MPTLDPVRTTGRDRAPSGGSRTRVTVFGCELDEAAQFREKAPAFGITPVITSAPVSESTIDLARGTRCISVGHKSRIDDLHLLALSRAGVEYISTRSIGFDHVDVDFARRVGITVENVAYSPDSVADYTLMLMLMAVRHAKSMVRRADAFDYRLNAVRGKELRDLTVGVIGTGRIGAAVIDRLRGFGCRILAHDSRATSSAEHVSLDELLERSDVITLHTPLDSGTHHLLDAGRFAQLKDGAFVINTGRGSLIDTDALLAALDSGRLGGAALDVLEGEDGIFYADHRSGGIENAALLRLQESPDVLISPHTAFYTDHALADTVVNSLTNCAAFESRRTRA